MTATEVLRVAQSSGIGLDVEGDRLVVDAPCGALTPELRTELIQLKPSLMALLTRRPRFVICQTGLTLPLPAVLFALDLERRGLRLSLDALDQVAIAPRTALTNVDLVSIQRWAQAPGGDHRLPVPGADVNP